MKYCYVIGAFRNNLCEGYFSCRHLVHPGSFVYFYETVSLKLKIIQSPSPLFSHTPETIYTAVPFYCVIYMKSFFLVLIITEFRTVFVIEVITSQFLAEF